MFFRDELTDPFNTLKSGSIHMDPVNITHYYVSEIWELLENTFRIWEIGAALNYPSLINIFL